jgi:hypothetical protein
VTTTVLGADAGTATVREAEHVLAALLAVFAPSGDVIGCTHLVRDHGRPHVAVSVAGPGLGAAALALLPAGYGGAMGELRVGPAELALSAAGAAAEHAARRSGRAVRFPGVDDLVGERTVEDLLAGSAIERVTVLGGPPPAPGTVIATRDFVRPQWQTGHLTLVATPAPGGRIAPFEVPNPTPCCADH